MFKISSPIKIWNQRILDEINRFKNPVRATMVFRQIIQTLIEESNGSEKIAAEQRGYRFTRYFVYLEKEISERRDKLIPCT